MHIISCCIVGGCVRTQKIFLSVIFYLFLFISIFYIILNYYVENELSIINCNSNVIRTDKKNNLLLNSQYTFSLNEKNGWLRIKGEIIQDDNIYVVNRKLYFDLNRNENVYLLEINEITTGIDDNTPSSLLSQILPLAYTQRGRKMDLFVYPQTSDGYIVTSSEHYGVYCSN